MRLHVIICIYIYIVYVLVHPLRQALLEGMRSNRTVKKIDLTWNEISYEARWLKWPQLVDLRAFREVKEEIEKLVEANKGVEEEEAG